MKSDGPQGQGRVSDVTLEQYLLGELSRREMTTTKRLLDRDESLRTRLQELKRSNRELLHRYPVADMSGRIRSELAQQPSRAHSLGPYSMTALLGAAAAVLLLMFFVPRDFDSARSGKAPSTERIKGQEPQLKLYRKTREGSELLEDGAQAVPGDIIRIGYLSGGRLYGVILSVDGRGTVTVHVPPQGRRSVRLKNDGLVLLDFALELDDAPRWERFYFVTGAEPFDLTPVLQAAQRVAVDEDMDRGARLDLPEGLGQFAISLNKGRRR